MSKSHHFYKGYIIIYENTDDKLNVTEIFYDDKMEKCDMTFNNLQQMKNFIDNDGWRETLFV